MRLRAAGLPFCIRLQADALGALPVGRVALKLTLLFVLWLGTCPRHVSVWDPVVLCALGHWFEENGFW